MTQSDQSNGSAGDETMKQVGVLEEATQALTNANNDSHIDQESAQNWIGFIVQTLISIFKK